VKVLIAPHGTRGDVQPLVALALGLRSRGHDVRVLAPANFVSWIGGYGIACESNGIDVEAVLTSPGADLGSWRWQARHFSDVLAPALFDAIARVRDAPDLVIGSGVQLAAASGAELWNATYVTAVFCPCAVPNSGAPPAVVSTQSLPGWMNRLLWYAGAPVVALALGGMINAGRGRLGLAPIRSVVSHLSGAATILAADPDLAPLADDAPESVVVTDAWILEDDAELDPRVDAFLDLTPSPLYVGFGSMVARRSQALAGHAVAAARALGRGAIISGGWAGIGDPIEAADDVLIVGDVPHRAVFTRVAAVVHHGGAGTTTAAARAGVPQVILPHLFDQPYWAHRIERLGLGPRALPVDLVNADVLTDRIQTALSEPIADRAAAFAPVIAARNGVADAVAYLEQFAG
jgi:vancomycin aglycone glucosyltransferase